MPLPFAFPFREVLAHARSVKVDVARPGGDLVQYRVGHQLAPDSQVPFVGLVRAKQK